MSTNNVNTSSSATVSQRSAGRSDGQSDAYMTPAVDVIEDSAGITLYADLPGVPKDKLTLNVESDTLTIEGEVALTVPEGMQAIHAEVNYPRFKRVFTLSKELDAEQVNAEFKQGVLKLHIPKAAQAKPRKINVNVH
jgi:HSP20 family protein